ncbi:MAG: hypothetical protein M1834_004811 [Cirrosporium novae-zelandiae]|nr:MAG: hypothetical protein M1834_004811 [Cirrosporium novae-zelandiae]
MAPWSSLDTLALPDHCTPTSPFLEHLSTRLNTCIPTPLALISSILGTMSIVSWLFAQLPQIYKNYTIQSTAGLSFYFLLDWFLGDSTNLLGAIFTRQAGWQIVVAGYYCFVDMCLVSQYLWYSHIRHWKNRRWNSNDQDTSRYDEDGAGVIDGISPVDGPSDGPNSFYAQSSRKDDRSGSQSKSKLNDASLASELASSFREKTNKVSGPRSIRHSGGTSNFPLAPSPRSVFFVSLLCAVLSNAAPISPHPVASTSYTTSTTSSSSVELAGRILSWSSTLLYLSSRLPQLYKNHIRRSTAGLSPILFIAAFFGNLFYSTSILTNPCAWNSYPPYGGHGWAGSEGSDRWTWVSLAAPFWLGAAGVLAMDGAVGVQFWLFKVVEEEKGDEPLPSPLSAPIIKVQDMKGRSHWRKVSGWMRGWVPSVTPGMGTPIESEGLLSRRLREEEREEERERENGEARRYGTL